MYRERFNLGAAHRDLLADEAPLAPAASALAAPGGLFALAWRNYMKSVFQKGFMYRLSCNPSVVLYIAENKTLSGRQDRSYEGEALGRKLVVVFCEDMGGPEGGLVRRVNRESSRMQQELLSIAEVLQTVGAPALPPDPERTAAQTELILERQYEHLSILRFTCTLEPAAPDVHVFTLEGEVDAEVALARELPADHRTKMVLARCLQRNNELLDEETLQGAWGKTLQNLKDRSAHLLPAPAVAPAPAPPEAPAPAAERGRGRGRGRGDPAAAPVALAAGGRRGRGRGRRGRG